MESRSEPTTSPTPTTATAEEWPNGCPTCAAIGFKKSKQRDMCEFCDGTFGGHPPSDADVFDHNRRLSGDDPCDEMMPGGKP